MKHLLLALLFTSLAAVACSSGDDDGGDDDDDSTKSSSGSAQSGSGGSSGSSTKAECQNIDDCQKLSCTCGGFSGAEVQKCTNGVCAKSCEEAGCN